ncbi:MAG: DUF5313 family protein [Actinobacteria bacterium]|nr:DUF5313 family protein [Actinomycetota bacterium]
MTVEQATTKRSQLGETAAAPAVRPGPMRWLGYAFGAGLPDRYDGWVLKDTTGRTWIWRHLARALVQLAIPITLIVTLVPGPAWMRATMVVAGLVMALIYSFGYMEETLDHRLEKAGYPAGLGVKIRAERSTRQQNEQNAARRERIAARRARRGR